MNTCSVTGETQDSERSPRALGRNERVISLALLSNRSSSSKSKYQAMERHTDEQREYGTQCIEPK